jgi:hypothetical protein
VRLGSKLKAHNSYVFKFEGPVGEAARGGKHDHRPHRFANQASRIVLEDGVVFDKTTKTIEMLGHHTEE